MANEQRLKLHDKRANIEITWQMSKTENLFIGD